MNQEQIQERLWEEVLNDSTNIYYNNNIQWNGWSGPRGGIYGEPIYFIPSPIGQEDGHNNLFVCKVGTDNIPLNDPFAGAMDWGVQYYVILNKDYEPFNQINRLKTSLNHSITNYLLNSLGMNVESLRNLNITELENLSVENQQPKELFTNNWWITMSNANRSNQKEVYPGFDKL